MDINNLQVVWQAVQVTWVHSLYYAARHQLKRDHRHQTLSIQTARRQSGLRLTVYQRNSLYG
jgi:hypothetical protein